MLVLTRRENQTITFGDPYDPENAVEGKALIEITVLEVRGDQVRIGIQAPRGIVVDRKEIWLQKREALGLLEPDALPETNETQP